MTRTRTGSGGRGADRRRVLLWLVPVVFLIHNVEQVLMIAGTMEATRTGTPRVLRLIIPPVPPLEYMLALLVATLAAFACAWWGTLDRARATGTFLLASLQMALLLNVGGHGAASFVTGGYTAGVATSVVVVLPFSLLFFWFLVRERWVPVRMFPLLIVAGILLHLPIFFGLLFLAGQVGLPGR